jgi:outer membrane cobalamin receptor
MTHRARTAAAVAILIVTGTSTAVRADDVKDGFDADLSLGSLLDTPEKVWTATKTEQSNHEAPAIITTVTREQIAIWGYRSVAEVLSHLLGFYLVDDHASPNLAVRGISGGLYADSSIVKVMIDGHSVAFHSTGGNELGPELIPLSAVERIEIVRGPGSALFGADAFLGVINIKTRTGKSVNGASAGLGGGWAGRHLATDVDLSAGGELGPVDVLVALRRNGQDLSGVSLPDSSPAPSVPGYNYGARQAHGLDQVSTSALARITYRPAAGTELGLFGYYAAIERGAEFGSLYQLANGVDHGVFSENRVSLAQLRAGLIWDQALGARLRLSLHGSVFRGRPGDDNRLEVGSEFYYVRRKFGFRGGDLDAQLEWTPAWPTRRTLRVVAGGGAFIDDEQLPSRVGIAKKATDEGQPGDVIDAISVYQGNKTFLNTGAYLQGIWNAVPTVVNLTGGLRYDEHNVYGRQVTGRVGLVSSPLPSLHAKLLYGSAFKAPSPLLLYAVPSASGDVIGNPALRPQYVHTWEFQLASELGEMVTLSSDVAYSVVSDKTDFVAQGINQVARNVARASTISWETMAEAKYRSLVRGYLSLELQRTRQESGQDGYSAQVVGSSGGIYPRAMVRGGVVGQPPRSPVRAAVQASYIGERRASDTNIIINGTPYTLPAYVLLEGSLSTVPFNLLGRRGHELSFALTGKNLLGATGPTPGFSGVDYPLAPRTFFLQMNLGI